MSIISLPIRLRSVRSVGVGNLRRLGWQRSLAILIALGFVLVILFPGLFAPHDPQALSVSDRLAKPSSEHLFGTDEAGRDIVSRMFYGARVSIGASFVIVAVGAVFGTVYGAVAGWFGGWIDLAMMRIVDVFLSFPYLVLGMAVSASLGRTINSAVFALALVWWPSYARLVRGQVMSLRDQTHVRVARTLGAGNLQLLRWHVVPHTFGEVNAKAALDLGYALLALTGLSFLGLGAQNPSPEWGLLIANAKGYYLSAWWYMIIPGIVLFFVVIYFNWVADLLGRAEA